MDARYQETELPWAASYRIIPSKFPPINFFEKLVDPSLMEALFFIESLTNDRLREEVGEIALVKKEDRIVGQGSSVVMASFTHISPHRMSRFSDGRFGVYYAASDLHTAVQETRYHRENFMRDTNQPPGKLTMRVYKSGPIKKPLVDIRPLESSHELYHPQDYRASQAFGADLKKSAHWGVVYQSVRRQGGECIAVLRPPAIGLPVYQTKHLHYCWNGDRIDTVLEVSELALENE